MNLNAKKITWNALGIALVCVATMVIQIPIPLGYCHLGNCMILLISFLFPWQTALLAGGIGSALADLLTGFPQWILPTLIIKSIMGLSISIVSKKHNKNVKMLSIRTALAATIGVVVMVAGYDIAGCIMYGNIVTGLAQTPGLAIEGIVGVILFYAFGILIEKAGIQKYLSKDMNVIKDRSKDGIS